MSEENKILVIRQMPEIQVVFKVILDWMKNHCPKNHTSEIVSLWHQQQLPSAEAMGSMLKAFHFIKDSRLMPWIFSDFFDNFGCAEPILVDSGHFRIVVPPELRVAYKKSKEFKNLDFEIPWPFDSKENFFMEGSAAPHRDIDRPHHTYQINTWFPLQDLNPAEVLQFFPEARYDFEEKLKEKTQAEIYENYEVYAPKLEFTPDPKTFGFGKPLQIPMKAGDMLIFNCQDPHCSPFQKPGHVRINGELRFATRCYDDNSSFRRTFWNLNNFVRTERPEGEPLPEWAEFFALPSDLQRTTKNSQRPNSLELSCAQVYFNKLFPSLVEACAATDIRAPVPPNPTLDHQDILSITSKLTSFPYADDRQLCVAKYLATNGILDESKTVLLRGIEESTSYFWLLEFAFVAIQNCWISLAESALEKVILLGNNMALDLLPFSNLGVPKGPINSLTPKAAKEAASDLLVSLDTILEEKTNGLNFVARRDPRLFLQISLMKENEQGFSLYKLGSYYVAVLAKEPFSAAKITKGECGPVYFAESPEQLRVQLPNESENPDGSATTKITSTGPSPQFSKGQKLMFAEWRIHLVKMLTKGKQFLFNR
tara:strand:+ start:277 stop:2064 length:1788 start_codon:yes stop_codon:yes gene_type:complete